MLLLHVQSGVAGFEKGFVKFFLSVPQAVGLNSSFHAAQASKGNFLENMLQHFFHNLPPPTVQCLFLVGTTECLILNVC